MEGRLVILGAVLFFISLSAAYQWMCERDFAVSGAIQFRPGYLQGLQSVREDAGAELTGSVLSGEVLSGAIRNARASYFGMLGPDHQRAALQKKLHVLIDIPADKLRIVLDAPYPHEAATLVNAVITSWLADQKGHANSEAAQVVDPAAIASVRTATAEVKSLKMPAGTDIAMVAALGLIVGIVLALYRGLVDERVRLDGQLEDATGLCKVGVLPVLSLQFSRVGRGLASYIEPTSQAGIQCALLLKEFKRAAARDSGTFLITSPARGDGRSTVALNLASSLAGAGESVVLVDADLEAPIGSKMLEEFETGQGLCDALGNPNAAASFARATHIKNLHLLSCDDPCSATGQRLEGAAMTKVLANLREKFSYVLLDSGPLLGGSAVESLAADCDGAFLVLHAQKTRLSIARHCRELLQANGCASIFAIVNARHKTACRSFLKYFRTFALTHATSDEEYQDIYHYGWFQPKRVA